ncbi:hypothetical protein HU200_045818 [Digitaria exilis]|uniref:DUF1618 domain-containing protein n=1 Tax=Digitaria exilis TaxID=1010633 RepID=A0A835E9R3_9POAL|nr:hypothetical protein HU200_045818 [Digitaria exilis]
MPKRRGHEFQGQRRGGNLAGKSSRPARRRKHLYLILDDWEKGFSIYKVDADSFDSDDDRDAGAAVAGHLPDPPVLRLESPANADMSFAAVGSKLFIVTDTSYGQTPALVYDVETAALAIGPAVPAGLSTVVAAHEMLYAVSPPAFNKTNSFQVMSCAPSSSHDPGWERWSWSSLRALPLLLNVNEIIISYAVHSDGRTIFMTTAYCDRPGLPKSTYSFNTKYCVWRWHPWALPFRDQGYFDSELDAWVGLHKDGYICSCELPTDIGSETPVELGTVQLDWQMVDDNFLRRENERYSRASLTYMGRSEFCLVKSVMRKGAKTEHLSDDDNGCVLHLTMFGLRYNNKGELRITNHKSSCSYRVTRQTYYFPPVAFWL